MRGNITRRGKNSWRIKFEIGADSEGRRRYHVETIRGTKADAVTLIAKRIAERGEGQLVQRNTVTVAEYAEHWLTAIAPAKTSGKTRERYAEFVRKHIVPHLGTIELQKLEGSRIDAFYAHLIKAGRLDGGGGLSPQTVRHTHRVLSLICKSAVKAGKLRVSPMDAVQTAPKVRRAEVRVLGADDLERLLNHLEGGPLYMPVLLAVSTGLRRGELLALRWQDINFEKATLQVAQVIELVGWQMSLKEPKTERSRRSIALSTRVVQELRHHRKTQAEECLRLGCSRFELVFPHWDGTIRNPNNFSKQFADEAAAAKLPHITFHGLRHTHITHLLRSGVPVHVVSARAGHSNPTVTLNVYSHLLEGDQEKAAAVMDEALRTVIKDR